MRSCVFSTILICAISFSAAAQKTGAYERGVAAFNEHLYAKAVPLFAQAEKESPGTTDSLLYEGKCLVNLGKFRNAEAALRAYAGSHPNSADALYMLGYVLNREDKPAESLKTYTKAAQLSTPGSND